MSRSVKYKKWSKKSKNKNKNTQDDLQIWHNTDSYSESQSNQ